MADPIIKPVRIADIAARSKVSPMAVSKVLHGSGGDRVRVSAPTADRIRRVAQELNYRPNLVARQLVGKRSKMIGAIIDTQANHTLGQVLAVIEQIVSQNGYRLMVGYSHDSLDRIREHVDDFHSRGVDGVISMAYSYPRFGQAVQNLFAGFSHCVFLGCQPELPSASSVSIDHSLVCQMATRHLLSHGRNRIALMLPHDVEQPALAGHFAGYRAAHREAGVAVDERLCTAMTEVLVVDEFHARRALDQVLPFKPDALVVGSDEAAMWYMKAMRGLGLVVPRDIAIVTLEHWHIGQAFSPSLTGVNYQAPLLAQKAATMLFAMLEEGDRPEPRTSAVEPILVIGESCGCTNSGRT